MVWRETESYKCLFLGYEDGLMCPFAVTPVHGLWLVIAVACDNEPDVDTLVGDFDFCTYPLLVCP